MTLGAYAIGVAALLAVLAAVGFAAVRLREWLLPEWSGSVARLAEAVLGLSLIVCLCELLGTVGWLHEIPLLVGSVLLAVACNRLATVPSPDTDGHRPPAPSRFPSRPASIGIAVAISAVVVAAWIPDTIRMLDQGIWAFDSMWYELPDAAGFAQSGSLTALHFYGPQELQWFFPANSEVFHAVGMVLLDRDVLSPLLNLGWLGLAFLAAWCLGRPYGVGAISTLAVAPVLVAPPLITNQAGRAKPDIATAALLLAAAALLINGARAIRDERLEPPAPPGALAVAGLAAGLAVGTRLNPIPLVVVIGIGLIALAGISYRRATVLAWFVVPVLVTSAFWYVRNLVAAGNPLPWVGIHLGPLSIPSTERLTDPNPHDSVADLITSGAAWRDSFLPGLEFSLGELWFLVIGLALVGMIGSVLVREAPVRGVIGAAAFIGVLAYLLTPFTATGIGGNETFTLNFRYVIPILALGLALAPTLPAARASPGGYVVGGVALLTFLFAFDISRFTGDEHLDAAIVVGVALATVAIGARVLAERVSPLELALYGGLAVALAAFAFWPVARDSLRDRYADVWPGLHVSESFTWANGVSDARIALAGTMGSYFQHGYYGRDLSNTVEYVGRHGPRGSFLPIETCTEWRDAINRGHYDYLVTTPTLNPQDLQDPGYSPERDWLASDPAASPVLEDGPVAVFRLDAPLDPAGCTQVKPLFSGLPPLLR